MLRNGLKKLMNAQLLQSLSGQGRSLIGSFRSSHTKSRTCLPTERNTLSTAFLLKRAFSTEGQELLEIPNRALRAEIQTNKLIKRVREYRISDPIQSVSLTPEFLFCESQVPPKFYFDEINTYPPATRIELDLPVFNQWTFVPDIKEIPYLKLKQLALPFTLKQVAQAIDVSSQSIESIALIINHHHERSWFEITFKADFNEHQKIKDLVNNQLPPSGIVCPYSQGIVSLGIKPSLDITHESINAFRRFVYEANNRQAIAPPSPSLSR